MNSKKALKRIKSISRYENTCKKLANLIDEISLNEINFNKEMCYPDKPTSYLANQTKEDIKKYIIKYFVVGDIWLNNWFPDLKVNELENNYKLELESKVFNKIQIFYSKFIERTGFYPGVIDLRNKNSVSVEGYKH